ncbi:MAG: S8 family peptidase [Pyrinomonadaceae bacterium]
MKKSILRAVAWISLPLLAISLLLMVPATDQSQRKSPAQFEIALELERDTFRGIDVAAKEILIKLSRCESADSKTLIEDVTKLARKVTGDDHVQVSQVGNDCWFLVQSSTLRVKQLMVPFQSAIKLQSLTVDEQDAANIIYAEPNFLLRIDPQLDGKPFEGPLNDDLFQKGKLWGLQNKDNPGIDIDAVSAWTRSTGSKEIVVGVVDTGVSYEHPDLKDNIWAAPEDYDIKLGTQTIHCAKGSHGYNAVAKTTSEICDPIDGITSHGHGTQVSGILGAVGNNQVGVVGVNWSTQIIGLKAIGPTGGRMSDAVNAIEFAIQLRARFPLKANVRVLNASWGYLANGSIPDQDSKLLREEIERANAHDILFVASAGEDRGNDNDAIAHYPSGFYDLPNVVSVTAIDQAGALAKISGSLSNHGKLSVHLAAPGSQIYSTYPQALGYSYYRNSGTSMAAPFVSGAAALILSVPACAKLHAPDLRRILIGGTVATRSVIKTSSGGRLNVSKSIELCGK